MAKHPLNVGQRERLKRLVIEIVDCPELKTKFDKLYEKSKAVLRKLIDTKYPPADIEVLRKYGMTRAGEDIKVQLADGQITQIRLRKDDFDSFRVPDKYDYRNGICLVDKASDSATLQDYLNILHDYEAALNVKRADYNALIDTSRYVEDLIAIWPEAKTLTDQWTQGKALVAISPDAIERIKQDVKQRQRLAKKAEHQAAA